MNEQTQFPHTPKLQTALACLRNKPGESEPATRKLVEAYAAAITREQDPPNGLPRVLTDYLDKLVFNAYKLVDSDFDALRNAGFSEDEIYEVTLAGSVGTSLARVEQGLAALETMA